MTAIEPFTPIDQPALPGLELTALGVISTGEAVDTAATVRHLIQLRKMGATWRWIVGDLVLAIAAEHDGNLAHAFQLIASEDLDDPASLSRSIYVARGVPLERRTAGLTWSHHGEVVDLAAEDQTRWLDKAMADGLTVSALRTLINEEHAAQRPDPDETSPTLLPTVPRTVLGRIEACWTQRPDAVVILTLDPETQKAKMRTLDPEGREL